MAALDEAWGAVHETAPQSVVPLLVVGAGRAALAFVARLPPHKLPGVLVVDSHGAWLAAHTARLARCGAGHVRVPHTGHPLPQPLALQAFSERTRRAGELLASSPRFSPVPTAALYADFVAAQLAEALGRRVELRKGTVSGLSLLSEAERTRLQLPAGGLRVALAAGGSLVAAQVVYAGWHAMPVVPAALQPHMQAVAAGRLPPHALLTAAQVDVRTARLRGQAILILGGGQTSAALALAALDAGAAQVTLASRGVLRRREQDIGPEWAGARAMRAFSATVEPTERLSAVRSARGGGAALDGLTWAAVRARLRAGAPLAVEEKAQVGAAEWDGAQWLVSLGQAPGSATAPAASDESDGRLAAPAQLGHGPLVVDAIWVACGVTPDARGDPLLGGLRAAGAPCRILGGLPVLDPGLRWPGAPLYLLGRYAALSLGPAAGLPWGHRSGAEALVAAVTAAAAAVAAGEQPYEPAAGALPLDMLYDEGEDAATDAPLHAANPAPSPPARPAGPLVDVSDLPPELPRLTVQGYAWSDSALDSRGGAAVSPLEGFTLEVSFQLPEPVGGDRLRAGFSATAAEVWAVGAAAAYRLHLPALYRRVLPGRCRARVSRGGRVTVRLFKLESEPWRYLQAA